MHSVICKFSKNKEEKVIFNGSLANSIEVCLNEVMGYIGFYDGYSNPELFLLKEHPFTTRVKPLYYAIPCKNTINSFRIYRHYKNDGYIFSEHVYEKVAIIKVVKTSPLPIKKRDVSSFHFREQWSKMLESIITIN